MAKDKTGVVSRKIYFYKVVSYFDGKEISLKKYLIFT